MKQAEPSTCTKNRMLIVAEVFCFARQSTPLWWSSLVPMPHPKRALVTLPKIPICASFGVDDLVSSPDHTLSKEKHWEAHTGWARDYRWIMFTHYQLLNFWTHESSRLVPRPFEMGMRLADFLENSEFQKLWAHLRLLGYYSCLTGFSCSCSIVCSTTL